MGSDEEKENRYLKIGLAFNTLFTTTLLGMTLWLGIYYRHVAPVAELPQIPCLPPGSIDTKPKNVIFMQGDGMGIATITMSRILKGEAIKFEDYQIGSIRTAPSGGHITDSAAAATAYATGYKTLSDAVSVFPGNKSAIGTGFEAAKDKGWVIGYVGTGEVADATSATYTAHSISRDWKFFISNQQVAFGPDLLMGGGLGEYTDGGALAAAQDKGYTILLDKSDLDNASLALPVLGLFSEGNMNFELDRSLTQQPSLLDMTKKALELFRATGKPFYLVIESDNIDSAGHTWDAASQHAGILALEETFQYVLDFAKSTNDTLVLLTADHECSGLTLGHKGQTDLDLTPLTKQKNSLVVPVLRIMETGYDPAQAIAIVKNYTDLDITIEQAIEIINATLEDPAEPDEELGALVLGTYMADACSISWGTEDHSAVDVNLYGYGPGVHNFCGNMDNTEIGKRLAALFEWDLWAVTERLRNFNTTTPFDPED